MSESLFNKVTWLQDCCKTNLLHAHLRFYFSVGKTLKRIHQFSINYVLLNNLKCKIMFTEVYLEPSRISMMVFFAERFMEFCIFWFNFLDWYWSSLPIYFLNSFSICFSSFSSFSRNIMRFNGCLAVYLMNPSLKKQLKCVRKKFLLLSQWCLQ